MRNLPLAVLFLCTCLGLQLGAQTVPLGMNYQGVARDAYGAPLANTSLSIRVSFTSSDEDPTIYYTENHDLATDGLGLFQLIVGYGKSKQENLLVVPWEKEAIWMDVEMKTDPSNAYQLVSSSQVLSVPYAMHAQKTLSVEPEGDPSLRTQSTRWLTSGNNGTDSDVHFLGTRDGGELVFKTNNVERLRLTETGQINIVSPANGKEDNRDSYPLVVEGSNQGLWIKIKESRTGANNFLTFKDPEGIQGRVEGETRGEFDSSSDFIRTTALFSANAVILGLKVGAGIAEIGGFAASIFGAPGSAVQAIQVAAWVADGVAISVAYGNWLSEKLIKLGVNFQSGAGDFAEYIKRAPDTEDILPGEIVGLKGGLVSRNTTDADHLLVISTAPAILGNAPLNADRTDHEKVAFMGQVLVRVVGQVAIGDYILASGNNDGYGVAVSPNLLLPHEYKNIVGVAWEDAPNQLINYVNVAIGLNHNDLAQKAAELERQINNITNFLEGKEALVRNQEFVDPSPTLNIPDFTEDETPTSIETYDRILEENEAMIKKQVQKTFTLLEQNGYSFHGHPELQKYQSDPIAYLKELRRMPSFEAQWKAMETIIQKELVTNSR